MPEAYQSSSSPEERSLLEEHIALNSAREKPLQKPATSTKTSAAAAVPTGNTNSSARLYVNTAMRQPPHQRNYTQTAPAPNSSSPGIARAAADSTQSLAATTAPVGHGMHGAIHPGYAQAPDHVHSAGIPIPRATGHGHPYHRNFSSSHPYPSRSVSPYTYTDARPHIDRFYSHQQAIQHQQAVQQQQQQQQQHQALMQSRHAGFDAHRTGAVPPSAHHPHQMPLAPQHMPRRFGVRSATLPSHSMVQVDPISSNYPRRFMSAEEKEIRRKVSHSAIEKRRRERTNAVLRNLQDMVPGLPKSGKIQKLEILEAAAEYIHRLKLSSEDARSDHEQCAGSKDKRPSGSIGDMHHLQRHLQHEQGDSCSNTTETQEPAEYEYADELDPRPMNVASPESASSGASRDGSGDDTLANPGDMSEDPDASPSADPSSMKVNFLLC